MRRLAVIDHKEHCLYVEDINEEILQGQYGGSEQEYIDAHYNLEDYSWDWISDAQYITEFNSIPIEINFDDIADIF